MEKPIKIDLFKQLKAEYRQPKKPLLLETTPGQYLTIDGTGEPGGEWFQKSVEALYSVAYTVKMTRKAAKLGDYVICKLEALWWTTDDTPLAQVDQQLWHWKLMIRTPNSVSNTDLQQAQHALLNKGKSRAVDLISLDMVHEGFCVQMLHLGPYENEEQTIAEMQSFMSNNQLRPSGPHHEIYISDPRRIEPQKLKTILRQPVVKSKSPE